jgi:hypothetical protein
MADVQQRESRLVLRRRKDEKPRRDAFTCRRSRSNSARRTFPSSTSFHQGFFHQNHSHQSSSISQEHRYLYSTYPSISTHLKPSKMPRATAGKPNFLFLLKTPQTNICQRNPGPVRPLDQSHHQQNQRRERRPLHLRRHRRRNMLDQH